MNLCMKCANFTDYDYLQWILIMCECVTVGDFFACADGFSDIIKTNNMMQYKFPYYFIEDSPCEKSYPQFSYGEFYYGCNECGQAWYFECTPEEYTSPIFGIKLANINTKIRDNEINAIKQFLIVLAHEGFSKNKCRHMFCSSYALNGLEVCLNHLGFGYSSE